MNENRTYGIEIETHSKINHQKMANLINEYFTNAHIGHSAVVTGYMHNTDGNNTSVWTVKTDSSIRLSATMDSSYHHGIEIVSPVLKGIAGLNALKTVCDAIEHVTKVSKTCGLHVHHFVSEEESLKNLINSWIQCETYFMEVLPNSRQENYFCKQWDIFNPTNINYETPKSWYNRKIGTRYVTMNLESYWVRSTVEFRLHSGTTEFDKISNWMIATQTYLDKALNNEMIEITSFDDMITKMNGASDTIRKPKEGSKIRLVADMIETGATKDAITTKLTALFGGDWNKNKKSVHSMVSKLKSHKKGGYGWNIVKTGTSFKRESNSLISQACAWMNNRKTNFYNERIAA